MADSGGGGRPDGRGHVAIMFARWVARPLSDLDAAAQRLGGGALDTRSAAGSGPPEVRRLASTFNTMAARLEALVHGNRAMMADVSHQLRTPLAALRLRLDLLIQDADEATASELADAQDEIARLSRLVDGLLAVARAENVVVEPADIAVSEVIHDRASAWRPVAEERDVGLTAQCHGPVGPASVRAIWSRSWTTCWPTHWKRFRPAATSRSARHCPARGPG